MIASKDGSEYATPKELGEDPSFPFSRQSLLWLIRPEARRADPELAACVAVIGRKVLCHRPSLAAWLDKHRGVAA